jgi:hypothetical protein
MHAGGGPHGPVVRPPLTPGLSWYRWGRWWHWTASRAHPPGGRSESRPPRPGPKAERKWCTASVICPPEQVVADAFAQAEARDPHHLRDWIVLVDGARHQLDLIHAEAARRGIHLNVLLDFVHVAEYCWTAAHAFHPPGSREAETWAADKLTADPRRTRGARRHRDDRPGHSWTASRRPPPGSHHLPTATSPATSTSSTTTPHSQPAGRSPQAPSKAPADI